MATVDEQPFQFGVKDLLWLVAIAGLSLACWQRVGLPWFAVALPPLCGVAVGFLQGHSLKATVLAAAFGAVLSIPVLSILLIIYIIR